MIRSLHWWKVLAFLVSLSVGAKSMNSLNMMFEDFSGIDTSVLGVENLDQYDATVSFSIDHWETGECIYNIHLEYDPSKKETPAGPNEFRGSCAADDKQGTTTDGKAWHNSRRHWTRLPENVVEATGLNHLSLEWLPCGRAPGGFRQARWDVVLYTVDPEYRAFMICDKFKTPNVCQYNQTTHIGRRMFTIPRLVQNNRKIANLPLGFQPDPEYPEAYELEGLTHYKPEYVPVNYTNWTLPTFTMTTYDSEAVSWRGMIPHRFYFDTGKAWVSSSEYEFYVYQTQMGLPSNWSTYYDALASRMSVDIKGNVLKTSRSMCGKQAVADDKDKIVFEKPNSIKADADLN